MTHTDTPAAPARKRSFIRGFFRLLGRFTIKLMYVAGFIAGGIFASTPVQAALAIYLIYIAFRNGWIG